MKARSARQYCADIGGSRLVFELVSLPQKSSVGVIRTHYSASGVIAQSLVFENRQDFARWLSEDEFRHQAPKLFIDVSRAFDSAFAHDQRIRS